MKNRILILLASILAIASCSVKESPEEPVKYVQFILKAQLDTTGATKTYMTDDSVRCGKVKWSKTDYLTLYNALGGYIGGIKSETATDISGDGSQAYFIFNIEETDIESLTQLGNYLFYGDANLVTAQASGLNVEFALSIPANQTHAGSKCFEEFENFAFGYCPAGTFQYEESSGNYIGTAGCLIRNAFGILKVPVVLNNGDASKIKYLRLTDKTEGQYLAGTFDVSVSRTGEQVGAPTLTHKSGSGGESRTIEKAIPAGKLAESNSYVYFLVPPGTLFGANGFTLAVYTSDGYYGNLGVRSSSDTVKIVRSKITQLKLPTFERKKFPDPEPLTANSYIFNAAAGVASFPAHYQGNGYQGNGGDVAARSHEIAYGENYYAEIIWQTKCNGETILAAEVVDSPIYYDTDSGPCISFHKSGVPGNALIALRDPSQKVSVKQLNGSYKDVDKILWSWHVWITSESSATETGVMLTQQYGSHSDVITIMDRNLGALYATPDKVSQTHGLGYQFGRKDPFMGSRYSRTDQSTATEYKSFASIYPGTAIYCVSNDEFAENFDIARSIYCPSIRSLRNDADWCSELVSWGDLQNGSISVTTPKSLYDPCPVGWRTFEEINIVTALGRDSSGTIASPNGEVVASGDGYAFKLYNNGTPIYFPASGLSGTTLAVTEVGSVVSLWGANYSSILPGQSTHTQAHYIHIALNSLGSNYTSHVSAGNMDISMPVRCQRWDEPNGASTNSGYTYNTINEHPDEY